MRRIFWFPVFGVFMICFCANGRAQGLPPGNSAVQNILSNSSAGSGVVNVLTPQSPAFFLLGTNPQTISSPSTPAELGADILSGLDGQGNSQSGLAINVAPYLLFEGDNFTITKYVDDSKDRGWGYAEYLAANTDLSFGTSKGTSSADKSLKAAVGFRTTIFDRGDPRLDKDFNTCIENVDKALIPTTPPGPVNANGPAIPAPAASQDDWQKCSQIYRDSNWNKEALDFGGGWSAYSPDGTTTKFRSAAWGVFSTFGYGFNSTSSYLILHGEYLKNRQVADVNKAGSYITEDSPTISAEYVFAISPALHFDLTGYSTFNMPRHQAEETSYGISTGAELEILDGLWIQLNVGGSSATRNSKGSAFVLSQFSFSTSTSPPVNPTGIEQPAPAAGGAGKGT